MGIDTFSPWRQFKKPSSPFEPTPLGRLVLHSPVKVLLYYAYHIFNYLRTDPVPSNPPVRIVCISDTHDLTRDDIPEGDILIHAGDLTDDGSVKSIQKQVDWLASLPYEHIIVISGNHDTYLDPRTRPSLSDAQRSGTIDWKRIHYLQHRTLTLNVHVESRSNNSSREHLLSSGTRKLKIYGAPHIPACGPMSVHAFQYPRGQDAWSETVPEDTDILVTHTPPKYHCDLSLPDGMGCEHLLKEVRRVKPLLHVFGHVHWGAGKTVSWWDGVQDSYEQGMQMQSRWTHGLLNPKLWLKVVGVAWYGIRGLIWDKVWGGQGDSTIMVNSAQMIGMTGKIGNPIQVVEI